MAPVCTIRSRAWTRTRTILSMLVWTIAMLSMMPASVMAIYPSDHWDHSTQLTTENFDSIIQSHIDADRTVFVRWIASQG
mmetsp:Transcript_22195/g.32761  ORF Transcript_22195/g.32761 Transcript_22195/m.32761 type:complete len:80 (-) Transcript_22195:985-1224(-)